MERREKVKRLNWVLLMGAVLLLGVTALGACPPGSIVLNAVNIPTDTINAPGTYCVPIAGYTPVAGAGQPLTIASSDVVIVGETPSATMDASVVINAGLLNVVLRSFTIRPTVVPVGVVAVINDLGAYMPLIDGVTIDDAGVGGLGIPAIILNGYQPEVRNCTFRLPLTILFPAIWLAGGMNAKIHDNQVIGSSTPAPGSLVFAAVNYNGLEVYNNTANMIGNLVAASNTLLYPVFGVGGNLTNAVIRDNIATIYGPELITGFETAGIIVEGANIEIRGNRLTVGNYDPYTPTPGVAALIAVLGTNVTVSGNILDASLGLDNYTWGWLGGPVAAAIITVGTNTTIMGNTVVGVKNGPAIAAYTISIGGTPFSAINAVIKNNTISNVVDPFIFDDAPASFDFDSDGFDEGAAIYIYALNARIEGNTINGVTGTDAHGILIATPTGNAVVTGNTIKKVDDGVGVFVLGSTNNTIQGNTLEDIGQDGVLLTYNNLSFGTVVLPVYADNNTVRGNTIRRAALRAVVDLTTPNPSVGDPLVGDYAGIRLNAASNNTIDGNTIEDSGGLVWPAWVCGVDVALRNVDAINNVLPAAATTMNNTITNNKIRYFTQAGNIGSSAIGILVQAGMNHLVQGNELSNTGNMQIGIDIRTTNRMTVKENKVEGMIYAGLYLRGGTVLNRLTVEGNKLTNNYIGMVLSAGAADLTGNVVSGGWTSLLVDRFGVAGQYKLENNCFIKPTGVHVRNDGTGTLTAKKSYWEPTPPSVVGAVDTSDPLASCPGAPAPTPTLSKNYGARAGWYMVSVPTTGDTAGIFGVTLYWWNGTSYTSLTGTAAIEPVKGYWANLPANKTVTASGTIPTTDQTIALVKGWNMISVPWAYPKAAIQVQKGTETKSWADAVAAGWVRDTIWGYDGAYQSVTTLDPWSGYWVKALVDGLSLKFAYASRLTTMCVSCLEAKAVVPEGEELPPAPPAASAAEFTFVNVPNPIRDVHTTTFKVLGPLASMVTEIKVQVFDLTGKLVWEGTAAGAELTWHTDDLTGAYLANGVYLYKVYVKVGDAWISSGVLKLVIQR
jgi:hypothetical protein